MSIGSRVVATELDDDDDLYPAEDGEPMAETPIHVKAIMLGFQSFEDFLADQEDVYIAANMFWYFKEGDPDARRAPDIMVIKGVGRGERQSFFSWRENGAVPSVIVEVVSPKKRKVDLGEKRVLYAQLGVNEYFCFDPKARRSKVPLRGFRRNARGVFVELELDKDQRLHCKELGLYLRAEGTMLRLIDAKTGELILTRQEKVEQAQRQVTAEKQRADALANELARMKAQLGKNGKTKN